MTFLVAVPGENNGGDRMALSGGADPAEWHALVVALCKSLGRLGESLKVYLFIG